MMKGPLTTLGLGREPLEATTQGDGEYVRAWDVLRTWEFKGQEEILLSHKSLSFSPPLTVLCLIYQREMKNYCVLSTCYNPPFTLGTSMSNF